MKMKEKQNTKRWQLEETAAIAIGSTAAAAAAATVH